MGTLFKRGRRVAARLGSGWDLHLPWRICTTGAFIRNKTLIEDPSKLVMQFKPHDAQGCSRFGFHGSARAVTLTAWWAAVAGMLAGDLLE